jgi:small-conductance mechanosensitive channel
LRRQSGNLRKGQRVLEERSKFTYNAEELNEIVEMEKDRIHQLAEQLKQLQLRGNVSRGIPVSCERLLMNARGE